MYFSNPTTTILRQNLNAHKGLQVLRLIWVYLDIAVWLQFNAVSQSYVRQIVLGYKIIFVSFSNKDGERGRLKLAAAQEKKLRRSRFHPIIESRAAHCFRSINEKIGATAYKISAAPKSTASPKPGHCCGLLKPKVRGPATTPVFGHKPRN